MKRSLSGHYGRLMLHGSGLGARQRRGRRIGGDARRLQSTQRQEQASDPVAQRSRSSAGTPWRRTGRLKPRLETAAPPSYPGRHLRAWRAATGKTACATTGCCCWAKTANWAQFEAELPRFRMNDDRQVQCYGLDARCSRPAQTRRRSGPSHRPSCGKQQRDADDGCATAAKAFLDQRPHEAGNRMDARPPGDGSQPAQGSLAGDRICSTPNGPASPRPLSKTPAATSTTRSPPSAHAPRNSSPWPSSGWAPTTCRPRSRPCSASAGRCN